MLVSILDWIIYFFKDSTSTNLKVVFTFSSLNRLKLSLTGIIRRWPKWLTNIHELCLDCTDLITTVWGWTLTGMVTKSGLDKISCSINFAHFSGFKNHFLFSYISYMSWFYILELFSVPKNTLFVSCFRAAYRHLAPRSVVLWAVSPQASSGRLMHHW